MFFDKDKLREARKALGMSQDDFGKAVGLDQRQISRYEIGKSVPTLKNQKRLQAFFLSRGITA